MAEAIANAATPKPKAAKETGIGFNGAYFEMPNVATEAFRTATAQWIGQTNGNLEKVFSATDEMNKLSEKVWSAAAKSTAESAAKVVDVMHQNAVAGFDYTRDVMAARSSSEAIEISTVYARKQFEMFAGQNRQLWSLAQQMAIGLARPVTDALPKAFQPTSPV
jgi:phasin